MSRVALEATSRSSLAAASDCIVGGGGVKRSVSVVEVIQQPVAKSSGLSRDAVEYHFLSLRVFPAFHWSPSVVSASRLR